MDFTRNSNERDLNCCCARFFSEPIWVAWSVTSLSWTIWLDPFILFPSSIHLHHMPLSRGIKSLSHEHGVWSCCHETQFLFWLFFPRNFLASCTKWRASLRICSLVGRDLLRCCGRSSPRRSSSGSRMIRASGMILKRATSLWALSAFYRWIQIDNNYLSVHPSIQISISTLYISFICLLLMNMFDFLRVLAAVLPGHEVCDPIRDSESFLVSSPESSNQRGDRESPGRFFCDWHRSEQVRPFFLSSFLSFPQNIFIFRRKNTKLGSERADAGCYLMSFPLLYFLMSSNRVTGGNAANLSLSLSLMGLWYSLSSAACGSVLYEDRWFEGIANETIHSIRGNPSNGDREVNSPTASVSAQSISSVRSHGSS